MDTMLVVEQVGIIDKLFTPTAVRAVKATLSALNTLNYM